MTLTIRTPEQTSWQFNLSDLVPELLAKVGSGELDRIFFTEQEPCIFPGRPMRFEIKR